MLAMVKRNRGKAATRTITVESRSLGPTKERMAKAGEAFTVGSETHTYALRDTSLQRMYDRLLRAKGITRVDEDQLRAEMEALQKYHAHWHHAGRAGRIGSTDLNRIFAFDPSSRSGMLVSESATHHRQQYDNARKTLTRRMAITVDNVVCGDRSLEVAGYCIGFQSKPQAIAGASILIREAGEKLAVHWGMWR